MTPSDDELASMPELKLPPESLNLTPRQKILLSNLLADTVEGLLEIRFNEPKRDKLTIRQHACLHGRLEIIREVLGFDAARLTEYEQAARSEENLGPEWRQG